MELTQVSTKELVIELSKRIAVQTVNIDPYNPYEINTEHMSIKDTGAATILIVVD